MDKLQIRRSLCCSPCLIMQHRIYCSIYRSILYHQFYSGARYLAASLCSGVKRQLSCVSRLELVGPRRRLFRRLLRPSEAAPVDGSISIYTYLFYCIFASLCDPISIRHAPATILGAQQKDALGAFGCHYGDQKLGENPSRHAKAPISWRSLKAVQGCPRKHHHVAACLRHDASCSHRLILIRSCSKRLVA